MKWKLQGLLGLYRDTVMENDEPLGSHTYAE